MAKRACSSSSKFNAKARKTLVEQVASEDQDISVKVLESFWTQKHFDTYESRSDFRELFLKEMPSSPQLLNCISVMKNIYKKLLA